MERSPSKKRPAEEEGEEPERKRPRREHRRRRRRREPSTSSSSSGEASPPSSDDDEAAVRHHFVRIPAGVPLGLHRDRPFIDEPGIRKRQDRQPHADGYVRNEKGEILDSHGNVVQEAELGTYMPFQSGFYDELYERQKQLSRNPDYRFAQLVATVLNKDINALWDMDNMQNQLRAERTFALSRKQAIAQSQRDLAAVMRDVERARADVQVFQQEENLIRTGIVDRVDVWLTTHHLEDWLSVERWLMPFYYRWQYRWMQGKLLQPGHVFDERDAANLRQIVAMDKRHFRLLLSTMPDEAARAVASNLLTWLWQSGNDAFATFAAYVRRLPSREAQTDASRILTLLVFEYFMFRDFYAAEPGWMRPRNETCTGMWLSRVILRHAHAAFENLPGLGPSAAADLDALQVPLASQRIRDAGILANYNQMYRTHATFPPTGAGQQPAALIPMRWNAASVLSRIDRALSAVTAAVAAPAQQAAVAAVPIQIGDDDRQFLARLVAADGVQSPFAHRDIFTVPPAAGPPTFDSRRGWYPWLEDYELACEMLTNMAAPAVLNALEALFPSALNDPAGAPFSLMELPRSISRANIDVYTTERAVYFRRQPTTGLVARTLAIGDLADYYHYNLPALLDPARNLDGADQGVHTNVQYVRNGDTIQRFDDANWNAPPTQDTKKTSSTVIIGRVLPSLFGTTTETNAARNLADYLQRRYRAAPPAPGRSLFQPFQLRRVAKQGVELEAKLGVELAVVNVFANALVEQVPPIVADVDAAWLAENAPLGLLAYHLLDIKNVYNAESAARVVRGRQLRETLHNLEVSVAKFSAQRKEDATRMVTENDMHGTLVRTMQDLYLPTHAGTARLELVGRQFFTSHFNGLIDLATSRISSRHGTRAPPLEALTNPIAHLELATAFAGFMAAIDAMIDTAHPHTYKTQMDHQTAPGRYQRALHELDKAIAAYHKHRGGGGGGATGYFL